MDPLKKMLLDIDEEQKKKIENKVVVVGYSISECLKKASEFLNVDIAQLDYEILERGRKSFFKKIPFRILVSINEAYNPYSELEEFSQKLGLGDKLLSPELDKFIQPKDVDGSFTIRLYKEGVFLTVFPPKGKGKPVITQECVHRLQQRGVEVFDIKKIEKVVKEAKGEPVKVADFTPIPENDSICRVEISKDEMKAFVKITPPKRGGRDLKVEDIVNALKSKGVVVGFKEEEIRKALDEERYMEDILAAEGIPPKHGKDARIEYKVKVRKEIELQEDEHGRVDFKNLQLIENVVPGQILAEKIPAEKGTPGRTLFNRILPARDGKDIEIKPGKNTVLSEDGRYLKSEINGQVIVIGNRISVEPVHRVLGDVGPKTGNIEFLGSVTVIGSVLDNHSVKAGGNIEIMNNIQKSLVEAEGNIIVKGGISGQDEGKIVSTGGSVIARYIQNSYVFANVDVICDDGIINSTVEAGERVICQGRRAQIVGGVIRAKKEVRAKMLGNKANVKTEIVVGYDPHLLKKFEEISQILKQKTERLEKLKKEKQTLETRKKEDAESFLAEQRKKLAEITAEVETLQKEIESLKNEKAEVEEEMNSLAEEGRVVVERNVYPNVIIRIKDASYTVIDERYSVEFLYDDGKIIEKKFVKKIKK
ncbi:MAG: FapA family protein [Leptospiraceae bacterium]|nr:FapA family protein [Leptospiraceae bacterium]MDW7975953.1 FapA family protein [Leptospiraceae bacterium]